MKKQVSLAVKTYGMVWVVALTNPLHKLMRKLKMNDSAQKLADWSGRVCEKIGKNFEILFPEEMHKEC